MLGLLAAWLLFPAASLLICAGLGLLVERAAGARLPGVLVLPVGMAALIGVAQLTTYRSFGAELTVPLVLVLAAAGGWLGRERLRGVVPDRWAVGAFLAVVAVYGAPVVLSGAATFAGYTVLGDTSIHFIGADAMLSHGRDYSDLEPSSYEYSLAAYYGLNAYPSGAPAAIGALTSIAGQDVAWTFQPFLSLLAALMALALYSLAAPHVGSRPWRAAVALLAATPALAVAYALQGSVKETGTAYAVVLLAALVPVYLRQAPGGPRRAIPLAVATGAMLAVVGLAAGVWLAPLLLATVIAVRLPLRGRVVHAVVFAAVAAVLGFQMLIDLFRYVEVAGGVVTAQAEFGNLLGPLSPWQRFGVWLSGDYRLTPTRMNLNFALIGVVALAAVLGVAFLVRRRAWSVLLFLGVSLLAHVYILRAGSPWADGKSLMIVSPAIMLAAAIGAYALHEARRTVEGVLLLAAVGGGVMWSNALAYHDVSLAPRDRMEELAEIGERIDGEGPTLYPEFEEFAKHFLRHGDPEGPTEGWQRRYELSLGRDGMLVRQGFPVDLDRFTDAYMREYRTIVLRRGFASSRPPSGFTRTHVGDYYEIWQRRGEDRMVEHLPIGDYRNPSARPDCAPLGELARKAPRLAYLERPANLIAPVATARLPRGWSVDPSDGAVVRPAGQGELDLTVDVERAGRFDVWLEGSFGRALTVRVGDRRFEVEGRLNSRGSAEHVGTVELPRGRHAITIVRGGGDLRPGNGGSSRIIGPVALTPVDPTALPVRTIPSSQWRDLCEKEMDWVEAVR